MSGTSLEAILNMRVRRAGVSLTVSGRLVTVYDDTMPGLSFALPLDTPAEHIAFEAVYGARARRAFIHGSAIKHNTRRAA
jgi:hypothetical protein